MKIPATVVTGFLGAGKTSLLRHLLANAQGRRIAVIINEFGDLGIDRELLLGCGDADCRDDDLIELPNGCICCTVADAFLPTMQALLDRPQPPEHIVVETSGLALPKPLVKAFQWPAIGERVTVDGVIAVIDAEALVAGRFAAGSDAVAAIPAADAVAHDAPMRELFEDQLACADLVVLNKIDALDERGLGFASAEIDALTRPATKTVLATKGAVDPRVVLGLGAAAEARIDAIFSHHDGENEHDHDEFVSFVADVGPVTHPGELEARIRAAAETHDILRIKGFVEIPGKRLRYVVQAVGPRVERYFDRPWQPDETRASRLVVIGQKGIDVGAVRAALTAGG